MLGIRSLAPIMSVALSLASFTARADDAALSAEIHSREAPSQRLGQHTISEVILALEALAPHRAPACKESKVVRNSEHVATSYDAEGRPCRVYDLAFPTATGLLNSLKAGSIPLQAFNSDDYLAWLRGDYAAVQSKMNDYKTTFGERALNDSWYGSLRFKDNKSGLRKEFRLSDIDLGTQLAFNPEEQAGLQKILTLAGEAGLGSREAFSNPEKLLSHVSLRWNELDKVFDVLVDFDFLPLRGPVALVDYNVQYKYAIEKLVRSALLNSLNYATRFIPDATARRVVQVALGDAFEFIDMAYEYQLNRLENTFDRNLDGAEPTGIGRNDLEKGANILAGQRSDLFTQFLLARILHTEFDLNALDKVGATIRYNAVKARQGLMAQLHSDLVLKKKCQMSIAESYFGVCVKPNGSKHLYSLLSSHKIFVFDRGAAHIHNYEMPAGTLLQRNGSWALAAAVRMFPLPIPGFLQTQLVQIVKGFATAGLLDEAFLINPLMESDSQDEFSTYHRQWMFRQNLIPFLAKSPEFETKLVNAGAEALEERIGR